jgi:hypothetical protein
MENRPLVALAGALADSPSNIRRQLQSMREAMRCGSVLGTLALCCGSGRRDDGTCDFGIRRAIRKDD